MSSRKRRSPTSLSVTIDSERHKSKHYSPDVKRLCVALVTGSGKDHHLPSMRIVDLIKYTGAPSLAELKRWKQEQEMHLGSQISLQTVSPLSHDYSSKLSREQLDVIGGFMLWRMKIYRPPHQSDVSDFVYLAYRFRPTASYISRHVHLLGFSKRRTAKLALKYSHHDNIALGAQCLSDIQALFSRVQDKSRIVYMDQLAIWDSGLAVSCYGVIGGYVCCFPSFLFFFPQIFIYFFFSWYSQFTISLSCCWTWTLAAINPDSLMLTVGANISFMKHFLQMENAGLLSFFRPFLYPILTSMASGTPMVMLITPLTSSTGLELAVQIPRPQNIGCD